MGDGIELLPLSRVTENDLAKLLPVHLASARIHDLPAKLPYNCIKWLGTLLQDISGQSVQIYDGNAFAAQDLGHSALAGGNASSEAHNLHVPWKLLLWRRV